LVPSLGGWITTRKPVAFANHVGLRISANTVAMTKHARAIGKEAGQHLPQRRTLLL
jgi:hypothetical protein